MQCLVIFITGGLERELALFVVVCDEVNQNGSALEYFEVVTRVVNESRNPSIRVDLMRVHS